MHLALGDGDTMTRLLPPNATPFEIAVDAAIARLGDVDVPIDQLRDPMTCPLQLLPWLAWGLSVDHWNPDWTEARKRSVIAASINVHQHKGTRGSVEDALKSLGAPAIITEWWETSPAGVPGTFALKVRVNDRADDVTFSATFISDLLAAIEATKRKSQHLSFSLAADFEDDLVFAASINALAKVEADLSLPMGTSSDLGFAALVNPTSITQAQMVAS